MGISVGVELAPNGGFVVGILTLLDKNVLGVDGFFEVMSGLSEIGLECVDEGLGGLTVGQASSSNVIMSLLDLVVEVLDGITQLLVDGIKLVLAVLMIFIDGSNELFNIVGCISVVLVLILGLVQLFGERGMLLSAVIGFHRVTIKQITVVSALDS